MNKIDIGWLIAGGVLIAFGLLLFTIVMTSLGWDFKKLSTVEFEQNEYTLSEDFRNISVQTDTADIAFRQSNDGVARVICREEVKAKHAVFVKDHVLTVSVKDERSWLDRIGIFITSPTITVCLPKSEYYALSVKGSTGRIELPGDFSFVTVDLSLSTGHVDCSASSSESMKIKTSTGNISLHGLSAGELDLSLSTGRLTAERIDCKGNVSIRVSTGKTALTTLTCQSLTSTGDTGDIILKNVLVKDTVSIRRSTGDIRFERCDAASLFLETDTGDVEGSLLKEKIISAETDTGKVKVPNTQGDGRCEVKTNTGDITITIF